ncbi:hypothetical protein FUAX_39710 (plasmid) [Fulvitalea axinellae]|uniref:BD-FAE-like domain-containing protein n=1 Tax=Fulvitalea axinellae TaxID=1182444 RepID=A0AAU9DAF1_9BACT|nr:hypothetical protein FUAX_39710 [Fulvitalea axinellae]
MMKRLIFLFMAVLGYTMTWAQTAYETEEMLDISYYNDNTSDSAFTKLNIVLPKGIDNPPVLMWLGGGAWAYVDRHKQMGFCRNLAKSGIAVISVGHRLSPALLPGRPKRETGIQHPEHIKDAAKAFDWILKNGARYSIDTNNIFVGGYSCGAHLSALLAADKKYLNELNLDTKNIRGIIPLAGAYDIPRYKKLLAEADSSYITNHINPVFGKTHQEHLDASPTTHAANLTLPILLMNERDTYVYNGNFEEEILKTGNRDFQVINLYDHTHFSLWKELSADRPSVNRNLIADFIGKYIVKSTEQWRGFADKFADQYQSFELPPLSLSYIDNLKAIRKNEDLAKQESFFRNAQRELTAYKPEELPKQDWLDYQIVRYQTVMNLNRISLEKRWNKQKIDSISDKGIYTLPMGKEWYTYFLKTWIDIKVQPDQLYEFGLAEIERVKGKIKTIQEKSGMDSAAFEKHIQDKSFFYTDVRKVQKAFEKAQKRIDKQASKLFPFMDKVKTVGIKKGENPALAKVPAFYNPYSKIFYYNYFDRPYNKRQIGWTYAHEGVPGHHYQISLDQSLPRSKVLKSFECLGYVEGYAAYVEEIGNELGAYQDIYDELGKWEWDLIRSVRVPLDVALNYYGWSDEEALRFWQKHIKGKDDIARREIARMKRWPAQVITYKYGGNKILEWKKEAMKRSDFNLKEFHTKILENGSIPFAILEELMFSEKRAL